MRALRFDPSTVCEAALALTARQFHERPIPKSDVMSSRLVRRANGHEKNVYASIGRMSSPWFSKATVEIPKPYDGML